MGKIRKWLRRQYDKLRGRFYEGPDPPPRLGQAAAAFASSGKHTTEEWIDFAAHLAGESYRSGYLRGVEWRERAPGQVGASAAADQEALARERHGWSWVDHTPIEGDLAALVESESDLIERMSPEERLLYSDRIAQTMGARIVLLPADKKR
jgi:hypothetical protein